MYNNNPFHETRNYWFFLDPDTGQENINCDPKKSGFHNLTIRKRDGGRNQYRRVEFLGKDDIYITVNWPAADLDVQEIRDFVEDAMTEILAEINAKETDRSEAGDGK
jgi:hypothetical protein